MIRLRVLRPLADFRRLTTLGLAALLVSVGCSPPEPTPEPEILSFPAPMDVEGRTIRSSAFLRAHVKSYDLPLDEFRRRELDPREATLAQLLTAVKESEYGTVSKLVYGREPWETNVGRLAAETWRDSFGDFEDLEVVAQVLFGSSGIFIIRWPGSEENPALRNPFAFRVYDLPDLRFRAEYVERKQPLEFFFLYTYRKLRDEPEAYAPVRDLNLPFDYVLVEHDETPVSLSFRGERLDLDLRGEAPEPGHHELAPFYQKTLQDFAANRWDEFLKALTPYRRRTARRWIEGLSPQELEKAHGTQGESQTLRLILDADPVFLAFSSRVEGGESPPLLWEYVVRDAQSGALRLATKEPTEPFDQLLTRYVPTALEAFQARMAEAERRAQHAPAPAQAAD